MLEKFVKKNLDVNGVILGEKYYSHDSSGIVWFTAEAQCAQRVIFFLFSDEKSENKKVLPPLPIIPLIHLLIVLCHHA
jgi:hypothetical protein